MAFSSVQANRGTRLQVRAPVPRNVGRRNLVVEARAPKAGVGIMGTKAGMTTIFQEDGTAVPCTVIGFESSNYVTSVMTKEANGYDAVQVGYHVVREKNIKKPELGHCNKAGTPPLRHLREFRVKDTALLDGYEVGKEIEIDALFEKDQLVDIAGTSIGKGFQGTVKRWGHKRGLMTHGSKSHRQHGSIGMCATPSRVLPGLKHAGNMGNERKTSRKLKVMLVDKELGAVVVKGSVPGKPGGLLEITPAKIVGKNC